MTPTVIHRLRCTLRDLWHYDGCGCNTCVPVAEVIAAIEQELAAKDAEIAELRKDAERWRSVRECGGLSVDEDGEIDFIASVAVDTKKENASWLTDDERLALDGDLTRRVNGMRNGWVWLQSALDRAADVLTAQLHDADAAEQARAEAPK